MRWSASVIFGTSLALVNRLNLIMSGRTLTDVNRLGEHMSRGRCEGSILSS